MLSWIRDKLVQLRVRTSQWQGHSVTGVILAVVEPPSDRRLRALPEHGEAWLCHYVRWVNLFAHPASFHQPTTGASAPYVSSKVR